MPGVFTHSFDNDCFKGQVAINTGLFINGKWVDGSEGSTIEYIASLSIPTFISSCCSPHFSVLNPSTGKVLTKVSEGTVKDVDLAVDAAQKAFDTTWGHNISGFKRGALLNKLADIMESCFDELCAVEALDNGLASLSYPAISNRVTDHFRNMLTQARLSNGQRMRTLSVLL